MPSMQKVWEPQSIENELEPKSKAQPVFDVAVRCKLSVLPLTTQLSLALLQTGQAYCGLAPALPAADVPESLSTTPPHAPAPVPTSHNPSMPCPNVHRSTRYP
jgi:hypothetical protein